MSSYRAPMRSRVDDVDIDAGLAVERAFDLGVVGVGGRLPSPPVDTADAVARVSDEHDDRVARRLARFMEVPDGAEVWTRDPAALFHRGVLTGPWRYDAAPAATSSGSARWTPRRRPARKLRAGQRNCP